MSLPIFQTQNKDMSLMQTRWATEINPLLRNPSLQSIILPSIALASGSNTINHLLGRKLTGWRIVRQRAAASIYDTQDANPRPELTLTLTSSAAAVCDIEVF
jgi:hypothetical protein